MILGKPDHIWIWTESGLDTSAGEAIVTQGGNDTLHVDVSAPHSPLKTVAIRWGMQGIVDLRILGDHWERGYGDMEWRCIVPERALPWYTLFHSPKSGVTGGIGVETGAGSFASWRIDQAGVTLVLDVRSGGAGVHLGSRTLRAATIHTAISTAGETPFQFGRRFCKMLCPSPLLSAKPIYGGNDWYYRYGSTTDATIRDDAALIRELAPSLENRPSYVVDCGWFPSRGVEGGPYDRGNEDYPDMPGLAAYLESIDVCPGIWIRPLLSSEPLPQKWQLPGNHPLGVLAAKTMDPTVPEALEQVRTDIARLVDWGYKIVKYDFSTYDITGTWGSLMGPSVTRDGWAFADRARTTAEVIRHFYFVIREAAGSAVLIGCNTVGHLGAGLFELQRTGDDTSGRHWERTRRLGVNTLAFRMIQHDAFFACDADCVGLRPDIPWEMNRQWLDLVARSGTPLFVSTGRDAVGPEEREALTRAFEIAARPQPAGEPLDWLETSCPRTWRFADEDVVYDWVLAEDAIFGCPY